MRGEGENTHVGTAGAVLLDCCWWWSVGVGGSSRSRIVFSVEMMRRVAMVVDMLDLDGRVL